MSTPLDLSNELREGAAKHRTHVVMLTRARAAADVLIDHLANSDEIDREIVGMVADILTEKLSFITYGNDLADKLDDAISYLAGRASAIEEEKAARVVAAPATAKKKVRR